MEITSGAEALDYIIKAPKSSVDMLITDWSMPVMDGVVLACKVRA